MRAEVISEVLTGVPISEAARRHQLDKGMVSRWVRTYSKATGATPPFTRARDPEILENLIYDVVAQLCVSLRSQLQATAQPAWLAQQGAGEIAQLLGVETERLIRLLAGFRPREADSGAEEHGGELAALAPPDRADD
jgi:transposase-like protein